MSFYINKINVSSCGFNNNEVSSIYYNNNLVWSKKTFDWIGWDNATWEDIYNMCQAKQEGYLTEYPSDVVLGATKTTTLTSGILGSSVTDIEMTLIGIDVDGNGILTFHSTECVGNDLYYLYAAETYEEYQNITFPNWRNSQVRDVCSDFYNKCDAKPYIKSLSKGTCLTAGTKNDTPTYTSEKVWLLSAAEMGGYSLAFTNEFTQGVSTPYPYYSENLNNALKGYVSSTNYYIDRPYWLRSIPYSSYLTKQACILKGKRSSEDNSKGVAEINYNTAISSYVGDVGDSDNSNIFFAPAFAIG